MNSSHPTVDTSSCRNGKAVTVDGQTLGIAAVTATARYQARVELDDSPAIKERIDKSRQVVLDKIEAAASVYGLSTGYGGSGTWITDTTATPATCVYIITYY